MERQVKEMLKNGATLVAIINYFFVCDYDAKQVIDILTGKGFNGRKDLIIDTLVDDFGMSRFALER